MAPVAARLGLTALLVVRFFQGLAYSADFAAIGLVCVRWAPLSETAIYIAFLTSFTPISAIITNAVTGYLCSSSLGWKSSYYLHGTFGAIAFLLWFFYYTDKPEISSRVSEKELKHIQARSIVTIICICVPKMDIFQKDKSAEHIEHKKDVPYKDLLTSPAILCVWFNAFCEMSAMILLSTYSPTYFRNVFGFKVETTGLLVSLTTVAQLPCKLVAGLASDRIKQVFHLHFFQFWQR
ncbi:hypothetical protein ANCCEY_02482 [Ancylostoma ceylanicum]|uniref:Major facilitator superfamily (MFS) profile domain-containing protein n=1 Tax=Ancylostoma ceylanicum TaxID=53326 RepID=A0A0D6M7L9_9BILA|nr:hypothetical protein ANCCEY_02482 [Ancylostoma ceylanicum]